VDPSRLADGEYSATGSIDPFVTPAKTGVQSLDTEARCVAGHQAADGARKKGAGMTTL
jgi:hypothetical protein